MHDKYNKGLANAKGPCDCSVLKPTSEKSLCSCPHYILDMTSFASAVVISMHVERYSGVGQIKPIFQVEENFLSCIFSVIS